MEKQLSVITETNLAWAAGFIDGEGCIALCHHNQVIKGKSYESYPLRLSVSNTDLRCLERLKGMFGGSINRANRAARPHHKPCWSWYCQAAKAENALIALLPYLFSKKEQAELGITSRKYIQKNGVKRTDDDAFAAQANIANGLKLLKRVA